VQGRPGRGLPHEDEAGAYRFSPAEDQIRRRHRARYVVGGVERVCDTLTGLVQATAADELMVTTMVADPAARRRTYELLGAAMG
jgi:alkanesulfonate monooxygenase SsuD/methylene tetrahydromethanopterin reductase-like flavin-dependent oxidoreductase (luciferase family)